MDHSTRRLCAVLLSFAFAHASFSQVTAIRAGAVLDPDTATLVRNQTVLVEGNKIRAIGPNLQVPPGAKVIDLSRQTLLPGLMDAHTHLAASLDPKWDLGNIWTMTIQRRGGYRAILAAQFAREMLEAGFTTVRDVGNSGDYLDMDLEKAIRFGKVPGPTIIAAGRIISPFGGQFNATEADDNMVYQPEYAFADSREEMRKAIRENAYRGAKVIKIVVDGTRYQYDADDIRFIVAESARAGLKVAAHVQTETGARAAIQARVASIEHGWVMTDEDFALAKRSGVVLVSTDFTVEGLLANGLPEERARELHARRVERLRRAYKAGVVIVFGTDIMNDGQKSRGAQALEYLDSFTEAGVPPAEILRAMTTSAARLLGVENERGSIKPGMAADMIAVEGNPLDSIQVLKQASFVMREGVIYRGGSQ